MTTTIKWNQTRINKLKRNLAIGMVELGYAIATQAMRNAPVDTGALVNSIRVNDDDAYHIFVLAGGEYGGKSVPYARMREYENRLHPGTTHYMKRAFESETKNIKKYFKGITK